MMQLEYAKLLEVSCALESFSSLKIFSLLPLAETAEELRRHNIFFRRTDTGFILLHQSRWNQSAGAYTPLRPLPAELKLGFGITSPINAIEHIAHLPFHRPGHKIFSFDNLAAREENGILYLNREAPAQKFVSGTDLFCLQPPLRQVNAQRESSALLTVSDARGKIIMATNCLPVGQSGEKKISCTIDLSDRPAGLYELNQEGCAPEKFYMLPGRNPNLLGVIDLYCGDGVAPGSSFIAADGAPAPKNFSLNFKQRHSTWRYHLIPKFNPNLKANDLKIIDSKSRYHFTPPMEITTTTKQKAFVIKSIEEIPVQEEVLEGIRLQVENKPRISDLQNPDFTAITVEENTFYSDVYVYV